MLSDAVLKQLTKSSPLQQQEVCECIDEYFAREDVFSELQELHPDGYGEYSNQGLGAPVVNCCKGVVADCIQNRNYGRGIWQILEAQARGD